MLIYNREELEEFIKANADEKYRDFHSRLTRSKYALNGIPIPLLRKYAKELAKCRNLKEFLVEQSWCYECSMLKGLVLSKIKFDDEEFFTILENYIAEIDDWALNDVACSGIRRKDVNYLNKIMEFASREDIWYARWGIVAVMNNFFDRDDVIFALIDNLVAKDYYVDMALAWLIQVLCVKNKAMAVSLLQSKTINEAVKKYAQRKIKDSFRISKEDKEYYCALAGKRQ